MHVLCANLVYLSFDRTNKQTIEGGLYKRDLIKGNSKDKIESGIGVAGL